MPATDRYHPACSPRHNLFLDIRGQILVTVSTYSDIIRQSAVPRHSLHAKPSRPVSKMSPQWAPAKRLLQLRSMERVPE